MREFVVELRTGQRITVRADHCRIREDGFLELVVEPISADRANDLVAAFERNAVLWAIAKPQLVSIEQQEVPARRDDIPF